MTEEKEYEEFKKILIDSIDLKKLFKEWGEMMELREAGFWLTTQPKPIEEWVEDHEGYLVTTNKCKCGKGQFVEGYCYDCHMARFM